MLAEQKLTSLKGVGNKLVEKLNKLAVFSVQDLLFHLPLRYQDKTKLTPISSLLFGQEALVDGEIVSQHMTQSRNPSLLVKIVGKDGAFLTCRFFHFHHRQAEQFKRGMFLRAYGEVLSRYTGLEIVHPNYKIFSENTHPPLETLLLLFIL